MSLFNKTKDNRDLNYDLTSESFGLFIRCVNSALIGSLVGMVIAGAPHCDGKTLAISGVAGAVVGVGARFVYDRIKENRLRAKTGRYTRK